MYHLRCPTSGNKILMMDPKLPPCSQIRIENQNKVGLICTGFGTDGRNHRPDDKPRPLEP